MARKLDFTVRMNDVGHPWFVDPAFVKAFTGGPYGFRCVAAIGPRDRSRIELAWTQNPKDKLWKAARAAGEALVVHECLWSRGTTCKAVLSEAEGLLAKASVRPDWARGFPGMIRLLLDRSAVKAGVAGTMWQSEFYAHVVGIETEKLRANLRKCGIDPEVVAAHRSV